MEDEYRLPISSLEGGFNGFVVGALIGLLAFGLFPNYFGIPEPIPTWYNVGVLIVGGTVGTITGAIAAIAIGGEPIKKPEIEGGIPPIVHHDE